MGELMNSGLLSIASLVMSLVVLVVGLVLWFFVNRASSRTNEQIELLEALLDQQKRQTALLRRLCEANEPEEKACRRKLMFKNKTRKSSFAWWPNDSLPGTGRWPDVRRKSPPLSNVTHNIPTYN